MKFRKMVLIVAWAMTAALAHGATIDMNDPRRSVGTDDGIRIDAQLTSDFVSSHSAVGVTYQIQNFSSNTIAVADKVCEVSYDPDSRTITLSIGSEIPPSGGRPRLVTIRSGEKKTLIAGAMLTLRTPSLGIPATAVPRFVQVRVNVQRDLTPFASLVDQQSRPGASLALTDEQFDQWLEMNTSIVLNSIPVRYRAPESSRTADAPGREHTGASW